MAWTCEQCATLAPTDDLVCPGCGAPKSAWTLFGERTRTFTLSGARVELLRGQGYEAAPPGHPALHPGPLVKADRLFVLDKAIVRDHHARGLAPPTVHVVTVRLYPRKVSDLAVRLTLDFAAAEAGELELPFEGEPRLTPEGYLDRTLLFVFGEGPLDEAVRFEGIERIVDVGEDTPEGFAPSVHVSALRKRPQKLPASLLPPWFEVQLHTVGGEPLAGWRYAIELGETVHEGVVGEDGRVHLDDVPPGPARVRVLPPEEPAAEAEEPAEPALEELVWLPPLLDPQRLERDDAPAAAPGPFEFSV